jgi:hypothetical protein
MHILIRLTPCLPLICFSAGKDTVQRIRARRAAANLPRFTTSSSSDALPATSSVNLLDPALGPTSSKRAGKDAELAAAVAGATPSSSKDAADVPAAGAASSSNGEQQQQQHGMMEHHLPPKMADGLPMDEDTETDNLLEFKETPEEVRLVCLLTMSSRKSMMCE